MRRSCAADNMAPVVRAHHQSVREETEWRSEARKPAIFHLPPGRGAAICGRRYRFHRAARFTRAVRRRSIAAGSRRLCVRQMGIVRSAVRRVTRRLEKHRDQRSEKCHLTKSCVPLRARF